MKTTLDLPDALLRQAKIAAAAHGQSLADFVRDAVRDKLARARARPASAAPAWMAGFGALKRLRRETARVQAAVDREFEGLEPEDRR